MHTRKYTFLTIVVLVLAAVVVAACGTGGPQPADTGGDSGGGDGDQASSASDGAVEIRYILWDSNQLPAYEDCAAMFEEQNPNISVKIEQQGWADYWSNLQTQMVGGNAPDVFTNHLAKYPEFLTKGQLVDIQPMVEEDGVDTGQYIGELADLWSRDGARFGLPKDWDTIAVVYNKEMLDEAGIDPADMEDWTWNPNDGGEFEQIVAQLTVDANGNNGLSPDFDPNNVEQYGFVYSGDGVGGAYGQTQWSHFAASNGWQFNDGPWDTKYNYEDPAFIETIEWYGSLSLDKGYAPSVETLSGMGGNSFFAAGDAAMTTDGSWMINWYAENTDFEIGFAKLPVGPEGRKSMFNGLADSIWNGSEHKEEAWEWVKFLASPACENTVGEHAVVMPAIESGVDNALAAFEEKGLDVSAYTEQALDPEGTFLFPITNNASEVVSIMEPALESVLLGHEPASEAIPAADQEVAALFE